MSQIIETVDVTSRSGPPTTSGPSSRASRSDDKTRVTLQLDVDPEGLVENIGDALGLVLRRAKGDLERFKELIEARGTETGA